MQISSFECADHWPVFIWDLNYYESCSRGTSACLTLSLYSEEPLVDNSLCSSLHYEFWRCPLRTDYRPADVCNLCVKDTGENGPMHAENFHADFICSASAYIFAAVATHGEHEGRWRRKCTKTYLCSGLYMLSLLIQAKARRCFKGMFSASRGYCGVNLER